MSGGHGISSFEDNVTTPFGLILSSTPQVYRINRLRRASTVGTYWSSIISSRSG